MEVKIEKKAQSVLDSAHLVKRKFLGLATRKHALEEAFSYLAGWEFFHSKRVRSETELMIVVLI